MYKAGLKTTIILLLIGFIASACSSSAEKDRKAIEEVIKQYDRLLPEGYIKMNMAGLREVCTENHVTRLDHRLEGFRKNKRTIEASLRTIEFTEFKFPRDKSASVATKEVWDIRHLELDSKKVLKEVKGFTYMLSYILEKQGKQWLIDAVEVVEEIAPAQPIE